MTRIVQMLVFLCLMCSIAFAEKIFTPVTPLGRDSGTECQIIRFGTGGSGSYECGEFEYRFDWGDSTFSEWTSTRQAPHRWDYPGAYNVRAQARCANHHEWESDWSEPLVVNIASEDASLPYAPAGPRVGDSGQPLTFEAYETFSNCCDSLDYRFSFDDQDSSAWSGSRQVTHTWDQAGMHFVKAQARCADDTSRLTEWSDSTEVKISTIESLLDEFSVDPEVFAHYQRLNDAESRSSAWKDSDKALLAKLVILAHINRSREEYDVPLLDLDILASRVANQASDEAARNDFLGHWNLRGEKPYHRHALAGGVDHVSENVHSLWSTGSLDDDYWVGINRAREGHNGFMAEVPPADGHKLNVIEAGHTHVGLGWTTHGGRFTYYEEYVDRYLVFEPYDAFISKGKESTLLFKPRDSALVPSCLVVYYESPLKPMTPDEINRSGSYLDGSSKDAKVMWDFDEPDENGFIPADFDFKKDGTYYVYIWLEPRSDGVALSKSTEDDIPASGVVFFVGDWLAGGP